MLHTEIKEQIKEALKNKDVTRLSVLRGVASSFTNELVATNRTPQDTLTDEEALVVIKRLAKQRQDSIKQFEEGGRPELASEETKELAILEEYLPTLMTQEEIKPIAVKVLAESNITDRSGMGKAIGAVMKELAGKADGTDVKAVVEELLK